MQTFRNLFVILWMAAAVQAADVPRKLAFVRDAAIYVSNLDGSGAKKVVDGDWPSLSPDGTRVAFNTVSEKSVDRYIAIVDVDSRSVTLLATIPSHNNCVPVWSPDGAKLIFNSLSDKAWRLGVVDVDGAHFHYFEPKTKVQDSLNSVAWTPDSEDFYAQDLNTLYRFALDGTVKEKRSLEKMIPRAGFSSGSKFNVSPDGQTLLLDTEMDEPMKRKDWEGPPPAVWTYDLAGDKAKRLSPKGLFAWMPCWLDGSDYLCVIQPEKSREPSIYRVSADGKKRVLIARNANFPSVSR
jgi:TolB protein